MHTCIYVYVYVYVYVYSTNTHYTYTKVEAHDLAAKAQEEAPGLRFGLTVCGLGFQEGLGFRGS